MRLTSVRLERYGPFADLCVALDPRPGIVNLVCAPNGAGKSVFRTACTDLLFGIGGQSPMNFRFDYKLMKLSAEAIAADGTPFSFARRKGQGNTLMDAEGRPADPALLAAHLGATTRATLEQLFALDTDRLRAGGERMLQSGGQIADALLSAGGLPHAQTLKRELEQFADSLAPSRRSEKRPFYVAADRFIIARAAAGKAEFRPEAWHAQLRAAGEAEASLAQARRRAADIVAAKTRLERLRRVRSSLAALDAARQWLDAHPDAPVLPASARADLESASFDHRSAAEKERAEASRRDVLRAELDGIPLNEALLLQEDALDRLGDQAGGIAKAWRDLPPRQAELAEIRQGIDRKLRSLGESGRDPAALMPPRLVLTRTRQLIRDHGRHDVACREATRLRDQLHQSVMAQQAALGEMQPAREVADLRALIARIRAQGDPEAQKREREARAAAAQAALARLLADVPFWQGGIDALRALPLPASPTLDRAHADLVTAETALDRQKTLVRDAELALEEANSTLASVLQAGKVPDREAVAAARAHREMLWAEIVPLAFDMPASGEQAVALRPSVSLALGYERAVLEADAIADRRADESALVEQALSAERAAKTAAGRRQQESDARQTLEAAYNEARRTWRLHLPEALPGSSRLAEVKSFVDARARALDRWETAEEARAALSTLTQRHEAWEASLRTLLPDADGRGLPDLLDRAEERLAEADHARRAREKAETEIARCEAQLQDAKEKCRQTGDDQREWAERWAAALNDLGRSQGESPSEVEDTLGLLTELEADLARATGLEQRIGDMRADYARFAQGVAATARLCGLDRVADDDAEATLIQLKMLRRDLATAREAETRRITLRQQWDQAARQATELPRTLVERRDRPPGLVADLGAATEAEAEMRIDQAEERAHHVAAADAAEARLREDGDGIDVAVLRADLAAWTADDVTRELYTVAAEMDAAQEEVALYAAEAATLRQTLAQREAETLYDDARATQEDAAAAAGRVLREALVARVAAALLGGAIEAVEHQGTPAMLRRISALFAGLTGGAYPTVGTHPQESGAVLLMTDASYPDEAKLVGELSEGTRDQLFLALRIAAIETNPVALPFIADDILQTADDARAEAALLAMVELSHRTQVILLTHHRHIAELASRVCGPAARVSSLVT